jgi:tRNA (guanine-N7-)-methyltransferase
MSKKRSKGGRELMFTPDDYFKELKKEDIFPDSTRPLEVDLGCGDGTFIREMAAHHTERDFLGVERLLGRALKISRKGVVAGLTNLRSLRLDSTYTVEWLLPAGGVDRVHLLFPDPWPKKKHHNRRLVTPTFCAGLKRILIPGGEFLFKSDHSEYFEESMETLRASGLFEEMPWNAEFYPQTDFEALWVSEGRQIQSARFVVKD